MTYWDGEKEKCRQGVIYRHKGQEWYLTRDYYMWVNFLPLYDKEQGKFDFPKVRDAQYHMALYEELARYSYKHAAILKKRQIASSYFHAGKMINYFWFEEGWINKMAASLKTYIDTANGTWKFLEEYRNFLNTHTAWYRPCTPDKEFAWQQKIEVNQGGRKKDIGLKSVMTGISLDKDPSNGVGGPCNFFFHEEGGIAPKADKTIEYLLPAMKSGMTYTGMFAIAGSVGDLDQCEPLREMLLRPKSKDILAVETDLFNDKRQIRECGLFIPEQWSMVPCIDEFGNSEVEKAMAMILAEREEWKRELKAADYQLRISQKPMFIEEAFASRTESEFPLHLVTQQIRRIEDNTYPLEYFDLERGEDNRPRLVETRRHPISEFPISPATKDKRSVLVVKERPVKDAAWGTYYASIDPVGTGKTTTSDSLCSIYVYKNPVEVTKYRADGTLEHSVEQDGLVAWWTGRFDDLNKTHEFLSLIIELYNAWTIVENNVSLFLQFMIEKRRQKYLVPKDQILFLKELGANSNVFQEYGWKNVGTIFKNNLLKYGTHFMSEELDQQTDAEGNILSITHGIERIPDIMLLREAQAYREGLNVDRLIAYCALVAFARVQQSNRGSYAKRVEREDNLENSVKNSKLIVSPFRHLGQGRPTGPSNRPQRSAFRNLK
jgi:hypothetical protein